MKQMEKLWLVWLWLVAGTIKIGGEALESFIYETKRCKQGQILN